MNADDKLSLKLHAICDSQGRPLNLFVTAGQVSDYIGARALLSSLPKVDWLLGDRGCDADWFREALKDKRIRACIGATTSSDDTLAETVGVLRSIPGIGPVASTMLIAEMPELGAMSGEQAAALAGLAPVAHDSGTLRGKRTIAGGRRALRHVMFQAALVAAHHNPSLKTFAERLRQAGKPHKVIMIAVARKLVILANALCRSRQKW